MPDQTHKLPLGPGRQAIYSPDAEEAILGCAIINPDCLEEVKFLAAQDFHLHKHRWVWEALLALESRQEQIDLLTIAEELERSHHLEESGGVDYLGGLINVVPTSLHAEAYARIVKRDARRRRLLETATRMAKGAYDEQCDLDEFSAQIASELVGQMEARTGAVHIREVASELYDQINDALAAPRELIGYSTGLRDLDYVLGGLLCPQVFYLSGKSAIGKSRLAAQLAFTVSYNLTAQGVPVAYYSMEMARTSVARRQLSTLSGVGERAMRTGQVADAEIGALLNSINKLSCAYSFFISDDRHWTTSSLRADLSRLMAEHGVRVFVLDYME